ncbi:MAG: hypothetical protein ACTSU2_02535 [Promethearchaeota archaeon]
MTEECMGRNYGHEMEYALCYLKFVNNTIRKYLLMQLSLSLNRLIRMMVKSIFKKELKVKNIKRGRGIYFFTDFWSILSSEEGIFIDISRIIGLDIIIADSGNIIIIIASMIIRIIDIDIISLIITAIIID